jgi:DNA primase
MGQSAPISNRASSVRRQPAGSRGFALLSPQFLDELRSRVALSNVVNRTVPLKKAGNEFKACCPFHQEKTPSFWVNDQKGFYHCFGCSAHGDAIRWLTDARGMTFMDAVTQLAGEAGLELPKPEPEEIARRQHASGQHEILEAAVTHFQKALAGRDGDSARDYLKRREITGDTIDEFRLGYAPEGRNSLTRSLGAFSPEQLVEAGLLISVEGKEPYDRFRNRVMVPIRDPRGRTIAFGGRILGDENPKYLNSPDTFLFDKSRVLFNFDRAAPASRQAGRVIVVEGYFDVIALDQAGIREAVAPMGTALTDLQLEQLWRLVDEPILCFDGDSAGRKAAERASFKAMESLRSGKQLRIVLLPDGQDPDDLLRSRGLVAFEQAVEQAMPLASFLYTSELNKIDTDRPEQRAHLRKSLDDLARSCSDRFVADEFARSFKELFYEDFGWKRKQMQAVFRSAVRSSPRVAPDLARSFVRSALYGLTRFPAVAATHLEEVGRIDIAHPSLQRWRDAIGEAVVVNPNLSGDGIRQLLDERLLPETLRRDVRYDLRFGFTHQKTSEERAVKQLEMLVTFLSHEQALKEQMAEHDKMATEATEGDKYEAIEAVRQQLREARATLFYAGANWDGELQ